jgi:hypothetical protein
MDNVCPIGFFCFNSQTVGLIIGIVIMIIVYSLYNKKSDLVVLDTLKDMKVDKIQKLENRLEVLEKNPIKNNNEIIVLPTTQSVLVNNDFERIVNPLLAPERSYNSTYRVPINIPTRGNSAQYQQVGAINSGTEILPLYGRPKWPGASKWNYYTSTDSFQSVKLPILFKKRDCLDDNGCDEVYDGDNINIPQYGQERDFKANIYRLDKPYYIPNL